jgi:hypothetical protein
MSDDNDSGDNGSNGSEGPGLIILKDEKEKRLQDLESESIMTNDYKAFYESLYGMTDSEHIVQVLKGYILLVDTRVRKLEALTMTNTVLIFIMLILFILNSVK